MRLFIGFPVGGAAQAALAEIAQNLEETVPGRYPAPELYHLTLAYLGERAPETLQQLEALLTGVAARHNPLTLTVSNLGSFPQGRQCLLYAAVEPTAPLLKLNDDLRTTLTAAGELFDAQPFTAHITLARHAQGLSTKAFPAFSAEARCLTLFHSVRIEDVLRYLPIFSVPLGVLRSGISVKSENPFHRT